MKAFSSNAWHFERFLKTRIRGLNKNEAFTKITRLFEDILNIIEAF
jgi:hypothetical protein